MGLQQVSHCVLTIYSADIRRTNAQVLTDPPNQHGIPKEVLQETCSTWLRNEVNEFGFHPLLGCDWYSDVRIIWTE